ncbi:MAG: hypothetical protein DMG57_17970 [Acidobacteria bacterium]|nr:MAG: hypothetical protein DMG57_17970 [Acidobacteriota bacterium]
MPELVEHPLGYLELAHQPEGLLVEAEYPPSLIAQHVDDGQPVLPDGGGIGRIQRIAEHLTMPVAAVHGRARVIYVLPRAAAQPRFHDRLLLRLQLLLAAAEHILVLNCINTFLY